MKQLSSHSSALAGEMTTLCVLVIGEDGLAGERELGDMGDAASPTALGLRLTSCPTADQLDFFTMSNTAGAVPSGEGVGREASRECMLSTSIEYVPDPLGSRHRFLFRSDINLNDEVSTDRSMMFRLH